MGIGGYRKRRKNPERLCREDGKHTLLLDFSTEDSTTWECLYCGTAVKFDKDKK